MKLWEPKRKYPKAVPRHLQNHVLWARTLKCSVKPYVTGWLNQMLFQWISIHTSPHTWRHRIIQHVVSVRSAMVSQRYNGHSIMVTGTQSRGVKWPSRPERGSTSSALSPPMRVLALWWSGALSLAVWSGPQGQLWWSGARSLAGWSGPQGQSEREGAMMTHAPPPPSSRNRRAGWPAGRTQWWRAVGRWGRAGSGRQGLGCLFWWRRGAHLGEVAARIVPTWYGVGGASAG